MKILEFRSRPSYRPVIWIITLSLTAVILLFPVRLQFEYHAIESLYIFGDNLPLFAVIYVIWLASLLILLFSRASEWQGVALISLFTLVFLGFWVVNTPHGSYADGLVNMGHVKYLAESGSIPFDHSLLTYFQFPGLHLTALSLSEITGLDIFVIRTVFLLFVRIIFAVFLYILFARSLKNSTIASLAVILFFHGSLLIQRTTFHPGITSYIFFVILLVVLITTAKSRSAPMTAIFLICFTALTITYMPLSIFFVFILGGIYILQKFNKSAVTSSMLVAFCIVIFLAWEMYWSTRMFAGIAGHFQDFISAFSNPLERLSPVFSIASTKLGESTPLWASLTRLFWLAIVFAFGTILGTWNLFRFKRLDSAETLETGGLWGVLIFAAICILAFPGGTQQSRVLMYASLFTVPIIMRFTANIKQQNTIRHSSFLGKGLIKPYNTVVKYAFVIVTCVIFTASLPTFLANHAEYNTLSIYRYEHSAGEFVETYYDDESLLFISDILTVYINTYYVPDADFSHPPQPWEITSEQELWLKNNSHLDKLEYSSNPGIYVLTERFDQPYRQSISIDEHNPDWLEFQSRLTEQDMIYNNAHTTIYSYQPIP